MTPAGQPWFAHEVLDRVVASMGNRAIVESDVRKAYQFELFLEGKNPNALPDTEMARRVLDQVIEQRLLLREAETEKWDDSDLSTAAESRLAGVQQTFKDAGEFQSALRFMNLDKQQVLSQLEDQERILRLIDRRFRPSAWVEESEVKAYYQEDFVPEYKKRSGQAAPPLTEVEAQIKEILVQKKIDQLLKDWLRELMTSHTVRLHEF